MKKIFGWVALLMGMVTGANAQVNDTIQRAAGNDLYQGITRKLPYRQMVTPHGVQVTFAKTVHIIFPSAGGGAGFAVRGFGKQLDYRRESGRCGERDPGEGGDRGVSGGNELFRHLRGREFLFIQCPVCARAGDAEHRDEGFFGERGHDGLFAYPHEHPFP